MRFAIEQYLVSYMNGLESTMSQQTVNIRISASANRAGLAGLLKISVNTVFLCNSQHCLPSMSIECAMRRPAAS